MYAEMRKQYHITIVLNPAYCEIHDCLSISERVTYILLAGSGPTRNLLRRLSLVTS